MAVIDARRPGNAERAGALGICGTGHTRRHNIVGTVVGAPGGPVADAGVTATEGRNGETVILSGRTAPLVVGATGLVPLRPPAAGGAALAIPPAGPAHMDTGVVRGVSLSKAKRDRDGGQGATGQACERSATGGRHRNGTSEVIEAVSIQRRTSTGDKAPAQVTMDDGTDCYSYRTTACQSSHSWPEPPLPLLQRQLHPSAGAPPRCNLDITPAGRTGRHPAQSRA